MYHCVCLCKLCSITHKTLCEGSLPHGTIPYMGDRITNRRSKALIDPKRVKLVFLYHDP